MEIDKEKQVVDNYIITTCITLLAAYFIVLTLSEPMAVLLKISITISMGSLIITLFECLWHKLRSGLRISYFNRQKEEILNKLADAIENSVENYLDPHIKLKIIETLSKHDTSLGLGKVIESLSKKKILKFGDEQYMKSLSPVAEPIRKAFDENEDQLRTLIGILLKNLISDIQVANGKAFNLPLSEKNARLKYYIDRMSRSSKYYLFFLGIIFLFISVVLSLI
jgi:hypothetical protein